MSLLDAVRAELPEMRARAEALMVDACSVTRAGADAAAFNPATGGYTQPDPVDVYAGKCRVQVTDALNEQTPEYGGREVTLQQAIVSVPIDATGIQVGDVVTITAANYDPELVGVTYRVLAIHRKTHATARRLRCEEVTA